MDTAWAGKPVCFYEELASTNLQAKLDAENGAREGTLIVADMQTAGRGRKGRSWSSPREKYWGWIWKGARRAAMATREAARSPSTAPNTAG